ncbi:2-dehydro-3-deoxygalactonokinase [Pelagibius litoralis]|uniref:2-dehydro-3-deoxygalactonokinase n=1 Tax=Pelagibius litoralis TaxID=374515 RepID=A0A967EVZ7_9PROT|nr:2-dehydro-3-deoxygalactonokinase [Pelagibius litoralis]NIA68839.1 2-dehydro-3-deoxygalactonokinase [Pelagibius litoralis]
MTPAGVTRPVIAVDWGTSSFRAYALGPAGEVRERRETPRGILRVEKGGFPQALSEEIGDWLAARPASLVVMSGMIGSRQGWQEVPYCACPCDLAGLAAGFVRLDWPEAEVWIAPGLSDETETGLPDVMRGEEVQIFGALADLPGGNALVCLPGTHSKWVTVSEGTIVHFATYMTGEVYDLLQAHSILGRLMTDEAVASDDWFGEGVVRGASDGALLHMLFSVRSRVLSGNMPEAGARAYLSGMLIGHEIAAALRAAKDRPDEVALLGAPALARLYEEALGRLGCAQRRIGSDVAASGLFQLAQRLPDGTTMRHEG